MNKINLSIRRMLLVASILFSFYTMLIPWVQINPVLSDLTAMIEETNNNVLDSVSSAIGTIMSFFDWISVFVCVLSRFLMWRIQNQG